MANEKRLIDANALCEFFQERYEYLRNASETPLPSGNVLVDTEIQVGAIIAKEFLDKAKDAPTVDAVEVVHGQWISYLDGENIMPERYYRCNMCGSRGHDIRWHYCPSCGAKMDGWRE